MSRGAAVVAGLIIVVGLVYIWWPILPRDVCQDARFSCYWDQAQEREDMEAWCAENFGSPGVRDE